MTGVPEYTFFSSFFKSKSGGPMKFLFNRVVLSMFAAVLIFQVSDIAAEETGPVLPVIATELRWADVSRNYRPDIYQWYVRSSSCCRQD